MKALSILLTKDPDAELIYQFDWTDYLADLEAQIASASFTITGQDEALTYDSASIVTGNLQTQLRLLGGTLGKKYTVTSRIETDGSPSNTDDRSIQVLIQHR